MNRRHQSQSISVCLSPPASHDGHVTVGSWGVGIMHETLHDAPNMLLVWGKRGGYTSVKCQDVCLGDLIGTQHAAQLSYRSKPFKIN